MNLYLIYIITRGVDKRSDAFSTTHAYIMLRTITATNYCNCFLHITIINFLFNNGLNGLYGFPLSV